MNDERLDRLAGEIRTWTRRPPERSPQVARTRVLGRIAKPRNPAWKLATAAAVLAVAVTAGFLLDSGPTPGPPVATAAVAPPAQKLLVFELESGTKLYLALANP